MVQNRSALRMSILCDFLAGTTVTAQRSGAEIVSSYGASNESAEPGLQRYYNLGSSVLMFYVNVKQ
jgi:hypothetical protein